MAFATGQTLEDGDQCLAISDGWNVFDKRAEIVKIFT
jgi:hypothetical protein